jgi:predicted RNA-binding Zn ribbon-like protein
MVTDELICDFVNTRDLSPVDVDELLTPAALGGWLEARGLLAPGSRVERADLAAARDLREALRVVLLANNGVEVDLAGPTAVLDAAALQAQVELRFVSGTSVLVPAAAGVPGALGQILAAVHAATADGSFARLKACRARDCEWAFVDNAKNQSRAWCSMRSCGNREKARVFRERRRSADS